MAPYMLHIVRQRLSLEEERGSQQLLEHRPCGVKGLCTFACKFLSLCFGLLRISAVAMTHVR